MNSLDQETVDTLADKYPTASWAIWSDDFPDEECVEEDPAAVRDFLTAPEQRARMTPNVVFVGLNPSGELVAELSNFHGVGQKLPSGDGRYGQNDWRLKAFIQSARLSSLTGGYMTDLSLTEESDSSNVTPADIDYEGFADQLRLLDQDQYTIIAFGNDAFDALERGIDTQTEGPVSLRTFTATIADRPVRVYRVYHYAYRYGGDIIPKLRAQLAYIGEVLAD